MRKARLSALVVDLGLTGLPNVVGIDDVRIVIPRLKVPLIFKSRPHALQDIRRFKPWTVSRRLFGPLSRYMPGSRAGRRLVGAQSIP